MIKVDGFGKACPLPVIMVKNEIEKEGFTKEDIEVKVDNFIAVENLKKLSKSYSANLEYEEIEGGYLVKIITSHLDGCLVSDVAIEEYKQEENTVSYLITHEVIGSGNDELGSNLMQMVTFAISQLPKMPKTICLMNAGVKLATENVETIRNLKDLEDKGVRILVCGACLNFYGLSDKLQVGEVSNAFEILSNIQRGTVIHL